MRPTITCTACGTILGVPKSGIPAEGLTCNWCGYVTSATATPTKPASPPELPGRSTPATPDTPQPAAPKKKPKGVRHLWGDDEDDDGEAYDLPPEAVKTRRCEACGKDVDVKSLVCIHCGYDTAKKEKIERTFSPIDREWESGWPLQRRIQAFAGMAVLDFVTLVLIIAVDGSAVGGLCGTVFFVALQAFLVGTYEHVRIRRNRKGQVEIVKTWRVAFVPMAPQKVDWREKLGVAFGHYDDTTILDWIILVVLLFSTCIGGILFWWFVFHADRFYAALTRDQGYPEIYLYRGLSEAKAREICQTATDTTGLPLASPL